MNNIKQPRENIDKQIEAKNTSSNNLIYKDILSYIGIVSAIMAPILTFGGTLFSYSVHVGISLIVIAIIFCFIGQRKNNNSKTRNIANIGLAISILDLLFLVLFIGMLLTGVAAN